MDHPLTAFDTQARPWRTATLVASAVAVLELVLLVVLGGTLLARHGTETSAARKVTPVRPAAHLRVAPAPRQLEPKLARGQVGVLILNGNGRHGAASTAASRVRGHGYRVRGVGNAQRMDYTRSIVMYGPGYEAEGRRLARDLGVRIVGPLDGLRTTQLHGAKAVLVVGA